MKKIVMLISVLFLLAGCSGNDSILVPGQSESDCDGKASDLGVCGTPKSVYENKEKIKNLWFEEDQGYYITKNGKIYNTETREEVIPGARPEGCNNAICPNCETIEDENHEHTSECNHSLKKGSKFALKSRSLIIDTPQQATLMRDLGWQQKIWIAPIKTRNDDLIEAHGVHVVVKAPSWIVGESTPKRINRGIVVPSVIAREVLTDNHAAISRSTNNTIDSYVRDNKNKNSDSLEQYIKIQKKQGN